MNVTDIEGMIPAIAATTIYVTLTITLAGIASGIVALGFMQIFGRERIHRRVLNRFFHSKFDEGKGAETVADALGIPVLVLVRLYYRQITGQLLAAANSEASRDGFGGLILGLLVRRHEEVRGSSRFRREDLLHQASRTIDVLQAELGDAVARAVMTRLSIAWFAIYLFAAFAAVMAKAAQTQGFAQAGALAIILWAPVALLISLLLALCSAAAGLVTFGWLDRFSAPK